MFSKLNWNMDCLSYFFRCKLFGIDTPECRRNMYSVDFVHNNINCSSILVQLNDHNGNFRQNNHSNVSNNGCISCI